MSAPVRFRSEAAADVVVAKEWYDQQRPGLGDKFAQALERGPRSKAVPGTRRGSPGGDGFAMIVIAVELPSAPASKVSSTPSARTDPPFASMRPRA